MRIREARATDIRGPAPSGEDDEDRTKYKQSPGSSRTGIIGREDRVNAPAAAAAGL